MADGNTPLDLALRGEHIGTIAAISSAEGKSGRRDVQEKTMTRRSINAGNTATTDVFEQVKAIRKKANRSWRNIRQAVKALQYKDHRPFSTPKVEASSKACVRKICRETGLTHAEIETLLNEHGLGY